MFKFFCQKNFYFFFKRQNFFSTTKFQPSNITKSNLIKLLKESLKFTNRHRLPSIISTYSVALLNIINTSMQFPNNLQICDINNEDFLRDFDILIIWEALRHSKMYNIDIRLYIDKLIEITTLQINSFSFIRLSILLHQISQLYEYINNIVFFDTLNKAVLKHLSSSNIKFDSQSICLLFNYIATVPFIGLDSYINLYNALIQREYNFSAIDSLYIFSSANKLYLRLKKPEISNIAIFHLNNYFSNKEDIDPAQFVNLCNKLLSNFNLCDLTANNEMYKELLNNIFNIINNYNDNLLTSWNNNNIYRKNINNLIKRLNANVYN